MQDTQIPTEVASPFICAVLPQLLKEHPLPWKMECSVSGVYRIVARDRHVVGIYEGEGDEARKKALEIIQLVENCSFAENFAKRRGYK